ncbi:MAG: cobalamin B12-binding domain-containing protein, partial [Clostridia bacterium]|nr:cobalamin B12-binding domain-containing protein [Clostridia bacterium]
LKNIKPSLKILCGGFGPTFYPKEYLESGADYVIRGEGEEAICLR